MKAHSVRGGIDDFDCSMTSVHAPSCDGKRCSCVCAQIRGEGQRRRGMGTRHLQHPARRLAMAAGPAEAHRRRARPGEWRGTVARQLPSPPSPAVDTAREARDTARDTGSGWRERASGSSTSRKGSVRNSRESNSLQQSECPSCAINRCHRHYCAPATLPKGVPQSIAILNSSHQQRRNLHLHKKATG